jgi:hypothetical protein
MDSISPPPAVPPPPLFRLEYTPTEGELVEGTLHAFRRRRLRGMLITLISAALLAAIGLLLPGENHRLILFTAIGLAVLSLIQPFLSARALRQYFRKHPQFSETSIATYSSEGLFSQTASGETLYRWHSFTHVTENKRMFFLHRGPSNPLIVAKRVFATPAELQAYRELLMHYIGRTTMEAQHGFPVAVTATAPGHAAQR